MHTEDKLDLYSTNQQNNEKVLDRQIVFEVQKFGYRGIVYLLDIVAWGAFRIFWQREPLPGVVFRLEATFLGWLLTMFLWFFSLEILLVVYRVLLVHGSRRLLGRWGAFVLYALVVIPLSYRVIAKHVTEFDEISIEKQMIRLRGKTYWADAKFQFKDVDVIYRSSDRFATRLVFLWKDRKIQSVEIVLVDSESVRNLEKFIATMKNHRILIREGEMHVARKDFVSR